MSKLKASDLYVHIGKEVRVVYPLDRGFFPSATGGGVIIVDDMITPNVILKAHNSQTNEITFQRSDGSIHTMQPKEVLSPE